MSIDLTTIHLDKGAHRDPDDGVCMMEAAALLAGEQFTDSPACTHPAIAAAARTVNDGLGDAARQALVPLIPRVVGTAGPSDLAEARRSVRRSRGVGRPVGAAPDHRPGGHGGG